MRGIHTESKQESYDAVVVGAGIGGLSTAALLAKAGKSVLLLERHDRAGGYAHSFKRRQFHFDSGVHLVSGCGPTGYQNGSAIYQVCQAVGIDTNTLFMPIKSYARAVYPGLEITLNSGEEALIDGLCKHFPQEKQNLLKLIRLCKTLAEEAMLAESVLEQSRSSRVSPAELLAHLFRYRRTTLTEALAEHLSDPRLRQVCASLWPYLGLPPSRLSFLYWACMMAGYTYEGGYYCRGSFQAYANALANAIETLGGEVLLNASVRRIAVEQNHVTGVVLENGQFIQTACVVSNVDAHQTADWLIGREHLPAAYQRQLAQLESSTAIFVSYLATDLPMQDHPHESFFYDSFDHEAAYTSTQTGNFNWFSATLPSLQDPSLAPSGQHIMLLTTLCPFDVGQSWRQAKAIFQERLLDKAEQQFPGLRQHLLFIESGSPRTSERYTLNYQGAAYGFAPSPDQIGPGRPGVRGPIPGLYHTGHWTRPGGGVAGVSVSALLAAEAVLADQ